VQEIHTCGPGTHPPPQPKSTPVKTPGMGSMHQNFEVF